METIDESLEALLDREPVVEDPDDEEGTEITEKDIAIELCKEYVDFIKKTSQGIYVKNIGNIWSRVKEDVKMVGGTILQYWSKCIIELQTKGRTKKALLRKHRSLPEKYLNFEIINKGVKKRGWI